MAIKEELVRVFTEIRTTEDMEKFLQELFTPKEMEDIQLRWQLLKELHEGMTQRSIASRHRMSLCKITRGSKVLKTQGSMIKNILDKMKEDP